MGFLDRLFKPKPSEEKEGGKGNGSADNPAGKPLPGAFLQPREYVPRLGDAAFAPLRPSPPLGRRAESGAERQEIVITLGDILSCLPTQLLQTGLLDARRELRFSIDDLSSDIARGRAAVPLSKIGALCPGLFLREITPAEDMEIRLPLQKLVEQIGLLRRRPAASPMPPLRQLVTLPLPALLAPPPVAAAEPEAGEEKILLHLAAILPDCPREIIPGPLPPIAPGVRIALPYALIEQQFGGDHVEISAQTFVAALPRSLQPFFDAREGMWVRLPVAEILQNLPGPPPPAPLPAKAPSEAAQLEGDAQVELAEFLAHAEDHSLIPPAVGEPPSQAAGEPPCALPDPAEVAAQTPAPDAAVEPVAPLLPPIEEAPAPVAAPPAPLVFAPPSLQVPLPEAEVAPAPEPLATAASEETSPVREEPPPTFVAPDPAPPVSPATIFIPPPPFVRPVLVPPPPVFAVPPPPPAPVPEPPPAPAPPPAAPRSHEALQALFMTDETLDLAAVCRCAAALPGLRACAIARFGERVTAGPWPDRFDLDALQAAAQRLEEAASGAAGAAALDGWQNLALHGEAGTLSLFSRPGVLLAALHRPLPPGVRERLATVAAELARS